MAQDEAVPAPDQAEQEDGSTNAPGAAPPASDPSKEVTKQILQSCLTRGLAALCKEKPAEPVRWLAEWLLEHNPNQPIIKVPNAKAQKIPAGGSSLSKAEAQHISAASNVNATRALVALDVTGGAMQGTTMCKKVPQCRVVSVGACTERGVAAVVEDALLLSRDKPKSVVWLSMREEACAFIGGVPYVLRALASPLDILSIGDSVSDTELQLKADVETLASHNGGRIVAWDHEGAASWISVEEGSVRTPAEIVSSCKVGQAIKYLALPTGQAGTMSDANAAKVVEAIAKHVLKKLFQIRDMSPLAVGSQDPVIISSDGQSLVTSHATTCVCIALRTKGGGGQQPSDVLPKEPLPITAKGAPARELLEEFAEVSQHVSALPGGVGEDAKLLVDDTLDLVARSGLVHLRRTVVEQTAAAAAATDVNAKLKATKQANASLAQYLQLLTVASGVLQPGEQGAQSASTEAAQG